MIDSITSLVGHIVFRLGNNIPQFNFYLRKIQTHILIKICNPWKRKKYLFFLEIIY